MRIELGELYITKTSGGYYSDWNVRPMEIKQKGEFLCRVIKGKDLPNEHFDLPFWSHELIELSPVLKELYE
jgi:hypothetical protein